MNWPATVQAVIDELEASAVLQGLGAGITMVGEREWAVPSIEFQIVGDTEEELTAPVLTQWTLWFYDVDDMLASEGEVRRLLAHDTPVVIQGVGMWSEFVGGQPVRGRKEGVLGRQLDFRFTPVRED